MIEGTRWEDYTEFYYSILLDSEGSELGSVNDERYPGLPSKFEAYLPYKGPADLIHGTGPLVGSYPSLQDAKDGLEAAVLKARTA